MISVLRGRLLKKTPDHAVVDVSGVGFLVTVIPTAFGKFPDLLEEVTLFTKLVVREDDLKLFGFLDEKERDAFSALIEIQNVGPKIAMAILATLPLDELAGAVLAEDAKRLTVVPGIGKKTAEKLLLELKDRFDKLFTGRIEAGAAAKARAKAGLPAGRTAEVRAALGQLGFSGLEIERRLATLDAIESTPIEETIRRFLQAAARG